MSGSHQVKALPTASSFRVQPPAADPIGSYDKDTDNLRILLEAEQYEEAATLASRMVTTNARNGLAWAAKSLGTNDVELEVIKCFEMADRFARGDNLIANLKRITVDSISRRPTS